MGRSRASLCVMAAGIVYVEVHADMTAAILREKQIKSGSGAGKIALIERDNPSWRDLYEEIV